MEPDNASMRAKDIGIDCTNWEILTIDEHIRDLDSRCKYITKG